MALVITSSGSCSAGLATLNAALGNIVIKEPQNLPIIRHDRACPSEQKETGGLLMKESSLRKRRSGNNCPSTDDGSCSTASTLVSDMSMFSI